MASVAVARNGLDNAELRVAAGAAGTGQARRLPQSWTGAHGGWRPKLAA